MKRHNLAVNFSNLDFEKIDTKILADEAKEQEETKPDIVEKNPTIGGKDTDESIVPPFLALFVFNLFGEQWLPTCFGVLFFDEQ